MNRRANGANFAPVLPLLLVLTACSAGGGTKPFTQSADQSGIPGSGSGGDTTSNGEAGTSGGNQTSGGGSDLGGSGGSTGFGGTVVTDSVTFDWPEATAGGATPGTCEAGHYSGDFTGFYASGLTFIGVPIPVAGNLSLTLDASADGEFFTVSGGSICGTADGLFPFKATVTGTLDCKTGQLVDGALTNGAYYLGLPGIPGGTFDGPLPATYDKTTHTFTGTWKVYEPKSVAPPAPPPLYGGSGDWKTTLGAATPTSQAGCAPDAGAP